MSFATPTPGEEPVMIWACLGPTKFQRGVNHHVIMEDAPILVFGADAPILDWVIIRPGRVFVDRAVDLYNCRIFDQDSTSFDGAKRRILESPLSRECMHS